MTNYSQSLEQNSKFQNCHGNQFRKSQCQDGVQILKCYEWKCQGIKRRFRNPKHATEHTKRKSIRYFVKKYYELKPKFKLLTFQRESQFLQIFVKSTTRSGLQWLLTWQRTAKNRQTCDFLATPGKTQFLLLRANLDISDDCELDLSPMIFIGNQMLHSLNYWILSPDLSKPW